MNIQLTQAVKSDSGYFLNPWETWKDNITNLKAVYALMTETADTGYAPNPHDPELDVNLPISNPEFGPPYENNSQGVRLTWLGHSTVYFSVDNMAILCDPIFSSRCFFSQSFGPKRYRPPPCQVTDLPKIDVIVISHNHFDHMDAQSITDLGARFPNAQWCVPSGCREFILNTLPRQKTTSPQPKVWEALWWEELVINDHKIVFTPTQHWSGRNFIWDGFASLWGSWAILGPKHKVWFAGDTGYCSVFTEIGNHLGPFDVAAIPIGAYKPRHVLKPQHVNPTEAVQIHRDIRAKFSIGIHWGTFPLGHEAYMAPKLDLQDALNSADVSDSTFRTLNHGQSFVYRKSPVEQCG